MPAAANFFCARSDTCDMTTIGVPKLPFDACQKLFIDVGANKGDSLIKFFTQPNCYENCFIRETLKDGRTCLPASETCGLTNGKWMGDCPTANQTCFCHQQAKQSRCGWEWPYWMPLGVRQTYCAEAFEPNPTLTHQLHRAAHQLIHRGSAPHIRVRNGTAWSAYDGWSSFGLDLNHTVGSSLILDKRTLDEHGRVNRGGAVGEHQVRVRTVDAIAHLKSLKAEHISLKVDVEGSEFTLLRDLLVSGALCERVDNFWIEWHNGRINWHKVGLPMQESYLQRVYMWMLQTVQGRTIILPEHLSPHCKTYLGRWA